MGSGSSLGPLLLCHGSQSPGWFVCLVFAQFQAFFPPASKGKLNSSPMTAAPIPAPPHHEFYLGVWDVHLAFLRSAAAVLEIHK